MSTPRVEKLSCYICDGKLTAAARYSMNFENIASFNRNWICDNCGAEFVERVEVKNTDDEETEETSEFGDDDSGGISRPRRQSETDWSSEIDWEPSEEMNNWVEEARSRRKEREEKEAERKRRMIENAKEMDVDWRAPFGTVIGQGDEFLVAQTLYKNKFALVNKTDGKEIKKVELVSEHQDVDTGPEEEWDSGDIPEHTSLNPSGILSLKSRPGWKPKESVHWCVNEESLFIFDDRGIRRHSATNDKLDWHVEDEQLTNPTESQLCCISTSDILVAASDEELTAIQVDDGSVMWSYEISDPDDFRLLVSPETLYLYGDGEIVSIQTGSGNVNWTHDLGDKHREQQLKQIAGIEQGVLVTIEESDTHYICGYDTESGERLWAFQDRRTLSVRHIQNGVIYVDGGDGILLALESPNGILRWQHQFRMLDIRHGDHKTRAWPDRSDANYLTVTEKGIVTCNWSGGLYLLDPQTGEHVWEIYPENADVGPETACKVVGDTVVRIKDTQVEGFDLASGNQQWSFETNEQVPTDTSWGTPVVANDTAYFSDYAGTVYGVNSQGLKRIFSSEDKESQSVAVDSEHVYVASLDPSADIPAYKKAERAATNTKDPVADRPLLTLFALSH